MRICWECVLSIISSILNVLTLGLKDHEKHKKN